MAIRAADSAEQAGGWIEEWLGEWAEERRAQWAVDAAGGRLRGDRTPAA